MRTTVIRGCIAVVFAVAAWLTWSESQLASRVADARQSLATFDYAAASALEPRRSLVDALSRERSLGEQIRVARAAVAYWLGRYDAVAVDADGQADADVLLAAANAAYRAAQQDPAVGPAAVQKLDGVLQAYAAAMKAAPPVPASGAGTVAAEAAYNYEFVARVRDQVAGAGKTARVPPAPASGMGGDLPAGPTIHGSPGGPPPDANVEELQTIMPMEYGDREAQPEPTPGVKRQRKG
jgi:hypothetical protein